MCLIWYKINVYVIWSWSKYKREWSFERINRLFSTSLKEADAGAAAYSIINTAQANGIDVREYLTTIFLTGERQLPLKSE